MDGTVALSATGAELWFDSHPNAYSDIARSEAGAHLQAPRIDQDFSGITTNPTLIAAELARAPRESCGGDYWMHYTRAIQSAAQAMALRWSRTGGRQGWVCGQVDPHLTGSFDLMLKQGRELAALGENVMVKVPGSAVGYKVVSELVAQGLSVNGTFSFSFAQFLSFQSALESGLRRRGASGVRSSRPWQAVFTLMIGRVGPGFGFADEAQMREMPNPGLLEIWGEVAIAKRISAHMRRTSSPSRLLLSSLMANSAQTVSSNLLHVTQTASDGVILTLKPQVVSLLRTIEVGRFAQIDDPIPGPIAEGLSQLSSWNEALDPSVESAQFETYSAFQQCVRETRSASRLAARRIMEV